MSILAPPFVPPSQTPRIGPPRMRINLKDGLSLALESGYLLATLLLPSEVNAPSSDERENLFLFFRVKEVGTLVPYAVGDVIILPSNVTKMISTSVGDEVVVHQRDVAGVVRTEQDKEDLGETLEREQHAAEDALWDEHG